MSDSDFEGHFLSSTSDAAFQKRLEELRERRQRKEEADERAKDRKSWTKTIMAGGALGLATVVAIVGVNKLTVGDVGGTPKPNPDQITSVAPNGVQVSEIEPTSEMTPAQRAEHDDMESGKLQGTP